jgi:hypothetical protein
MQGLASSPVGQRNTIVGQPQSSPGNNPVWSMRIIRYAILLATEVRLGMLARCVVKHCGDSIHGTIVAKVCRAAGEQDAKQWRQLFYNAAQKLRTLNQVQHRGMPE